MPSRKPKPEEKPQSERFIETAREIGADETPEAFERAFGRIAKVSNVGKQCQEPSRPRKSGEKGAL